MLKSYDMPDLTPAGKKRERTDGQEQLWNTMNIAFEPVEGKPEEEATDMYLTGVNEAEDEGDDTTKAKSAFLDSLKEAILSRKDPITKEWQEVLDLKTEYENPNRTDVQREAIFQQLKIAYKNYMAQPPQGSTSEGLPSPGKKLHGSTPQEKKQKDKPLEDTIAFAQHILQMGLSYVHEFVGMLGTRLADRDVRSYYKWKGKGATQDELQSPLEVDGSVKTIQDLIRKNMHLGREMCAVILDQYNVLNGPTLTPPVPPDLAKAQLIGVDVPLDLNDVFGFDLQKHGDALDILLKTEGIEDETGGFVTGVKKDWVFGLLDLSAFAHILSVGTMGAMSLAVGQIRRIPGCAKFTLKQLLMSEGVRDIFAIFVAFQYLMSSGGNAYAGRSSSQGKANGTTFMISAGLETRKMLYAQVETAQYWFRDVYEVDNSLYKGLEARKNSIREKRAELARNMSAVQIAAIDALTLNSKTVIEELNKLLGTLPAVSPTRDYIENVRDEHKLGKLMEGLPKKILRHAN